MWDQVWDEIFTANEWGKYPPEELIRFVARNYYQAQDRSQVKFLEVGSGTGANLWYLAREGFSVTGIDGSSVACQRAQERLSMEHLTGEFVTGDIVKLPFQDRIFDCVIDQECIYANTYADSKKIIKEIFRVLKPGGRFFMKTFMVGTTGGLRLNCGLIRLTSEQEIPDLCDGFIIESIDYSLRSEKNRAYEIKELIVIGRKPE
ncbi:MAG: class I SAM-dependent methyltransferase [Candidatus Omnitrophica bacterium]|nr:class I SAM-dependent methyltransferase [Candidatus Omnitrophota bacterium]